MSDKYASKYGITIMVPDTLVESIIKRGMRPQDFLSHLIEKCYVESDFEALYAYLSGESSNLPITWKKKIDQRFENYSHYLEWKSNTFSNYMEQLVLNAGASDSEKILITFLIAYYKLGSRPNSEALRKFLKMETGDSWFERLRVIKSKLTIAAKHMNLPSFFLRAYGSGMDRTYPISDEVYLLLHDWFEANSKIVDKFGQC